MAEEVSIWGWPLQTAGVLTAEYYSRSFSIINGRVTEVSSFNMKYYIISYYATYTFLHVPSWLTVFVLGSVVDLSKLYCELILSGMSYVLIVLNLFLVS